MELLIALFAPIELPALAATLATMIGGKATPRREGKEDPAIWVEADDTLLQVTWFQGYDLPGDIPLSKATAYVRVPDASWFEKLKALDMPMMLLEDTETERARYRMGDVATAA